jgi:hypothetical protein
MSFSKEDLDVNNNLSQVQTQSFSVISLPICGKCDELTYTKYDEFLEENVSCCCNSIITNNDSGD